MALMDCIQPHSGRAEVVWAMQVRKCVEGGAGNSHDGCQAKRVITHRCFIVVLRFVYALFGSSARRLGPPGLQATPLLREGGFRDVSQDSFATHDLSAAVAKTSDTRQNHIEQGRGITRGHDGAWCMYSNVGKGAHYQPKGWWVIESEFCAPCLISIPKYFMLVIRRGLAGCGWMWMQVLCILCSYWRCR